MDLVSLFVLSIPFPSPQLCSYCKGGFHAKAGEEVIFLKIEPKKYVLENQKPNKEERE
jgi:hypothetical protein